MDAETTRRLDALEVLGAVAPETRRHIESLPPEEARREVQRLLAALARQAATPGLSSAAAGGLAADILATPPTVGGSSEVVSPDGGRGQSTLKLGPRGLGGTRDLVAAPPTIGGEAGTAATGASPRPAKYERLLGPYEIVRELGRGAMGVVYLAEDRDLHRLVALKVLPKGVTDDGELLERFRREASACASLSNPHIVSVMGMGQAEDLHYYAMEYVEGKSLADVIAKERITPERAAVLARQAAEGLGHAHAKGVIHRDVKPANMIVTCRLVEKPATKTKRERSAFKAASTSWKDSDVGGLVSLGLPRGVSDSEESVIRLLEDFVKVADFGLARVEGGKTLTATGHVMGTPAYMAPEQARGAKEEVGPASDVYSLGATLFEMLTGKRPFDADDMPSLMKKIIYEDPPRPRSLAPTLDRDLETITLKCLEKDPSKRYAHAGKLAEELGRWLRDEPIHARPVRLPGRLWRRVRRNRAVAGLTAGLLVCVLAVIGVTLQYTLVPKLREAAKQRQEARERADRKAAADALLARAQAALGGKRLDDTARLANELLSTYASWAEKGEELPISDAHALLGDLHRAKDESKPALVEYYRAFEATIGTPRAAETLVRVGDQLYDMEEFEKAQGTYSRALEEGASGRLEFSAQYGLARCLFSLMKFDEARNGFLAIKNSPESSPQEREWLNDALRWSELVGSSVEVSVSLRVFVAADIEGDGRPELIGFPPNGRDVVIGRVEGTTFVELGRAQVLTAESYYLGALDALDVDADGSKEILAAGGDPDKGVGRLFLLRWDGNSLKTVASTALTSTVCGGLGEHGFALADVDGDGSRELAVGTSIYERGLRVYKFDPARSELELIASLPLGGDTNAVFARDVNGDGRDEIWVLAGPWKAYSLIAVEFDPGNRQLVRKSVTPLASTVRADESTYSGLGDRFLVAATWWLPCLGPLRESYGTKRFESTFKPPGIYEIRLHSDFSVDVQPVWSLPWSAAGEKGSMVARLPSDGGDFVFTSSGGALELSLADTGWHLGSPVSLYRQKSHGWELLCHLAPPTPFYMNSHALDIDGDGDCELVQFAGFGGDALHAHLVIAGLRSDQTAPPPITRVPTLESTGLASRPAPSTILATREAERLGLDEDVVRLSTQTLESARDVETAEEAFRSLVGAWIRLEHVDRALEVGSELIARYPGLKAIVLRVLLESTEQLGHWQSAVALARDLSSEPSLTKEEHRELEQRIQYLQALREPLPVLDLVRGDFWTSDLLAPTPLHCEREGQSGCHLYKCSQGFQGIFVPLEYDSSNYRFELRARLERLDWGAGFRFGLFAGDPAAFASRVTRGVVSGIQSELPRPTPYDELYLVAEGETAAPMSVLFLSSMRPGDSCVRHFNWDFCHTGDTFEAVLEYAPHQRLLRCAASAPGHRHAVNAVRPPIADDRVYLFLAGYEVTGTSEHWSDTSILDLKLAAGDASVRLATFRPQSTTDLLFLANGRYVQGRMEDANRLYGQAIFAGDLEAANDAALKGQGVPTLSDVVWTREARIWVSVDARLWRSLLRVEQGDTAGAREDLQQAFQRSEERCAHLLKTSALPLQQHPEACALLREFLIKRAGTDTTTGLDAFANELLEKWSADFADALIADVGLHVARLAAIAKAEAESGECPLKPGDIVVNYDGKDIHAWPEVRRFHAEARDAEKTSVQVVVVRDGKRLSFEVDPRPVMLSAQELQRIERLPGR